MAKHSIAGSVERARKSLNKIMHSLDITKLADEGQLEMDNQELMKIFLSAKHVIEGCSENLWSIMK